MCMGVHCVCECVYALWGVQCTVCVCVCVCVLLRVCHGFDSCIIIIII